MDLLENYNQWFDGHSMHYALKALEACSDVANSILSSRSRDGIVIV